VAKGVGVRHDGLTVSIFLEVLFTQDNPRLIVMIIGKGPMSDLMSKTLLQYSTSVTPRIPVATEFSNELPRVGGTSLIMFATRNSQG
jgi:hypothetical protein